jgi:signal transduction histidine kinase
MRPPVDGGQTASRWIVSEQSTLRRIATLVAEAASPDVVLAAAAQAVATLLNLRHDAPDAASVAVLRYDADGAATLMAQAGGDGQPSRVGGRVLRGGRNATTLVHETARPARLEAAVGVPISAGDRLWGVTVASCAEAGALGPETERLLAQFCGLMGTAIANTETRLEADRLAAEQASLRHVATLVARQAAPGELFESVAREVGVLLEVDSAAVLRLEDDEMLTVLAAWGQPDLDTFVGRRLPLAGDNVAARSLATGRAARIDDHSGGAGDIAAIVRELEISSSVAGPVMVEGRLWGWIAVNKLRSGLPSTIEARLEAFAELVAVAIANAESQAQLAASRARVLASADDARRQIQRDLHDGAQQRLVHVLISLQMAADAAAADGPAATLIDQALLHADRANTELRELVHGILPAALTQGGLRDGLAALATDCALPVDLRADLPRLPAEIETTTYFIVAEALTNAVKHARASCASVEVVLAGGELAAVVNDDGVGGADPRAGSGLTGLYDRVGANGGTLSITSPLGEGTEIRAVLRLDVP